MILEWSNTSFLATTTLYPPHLLLLRYNTCAYFYYDNVALMLWATASVFCFFALISTIFTIYHTYQLWSTVQDLENSIIDLIDESCQILLPLGVCKQICHPHHIGTVNANYAGGQKGQKQEQKCQKDNRYPEDVTFPPSDVEKVYDVMGDEDARRSKTLIITEDYGEFKTEKGEVKVSGELQLQKTAKSREQISEEKKPVQQVKSSDKAIKSREKLGSETPRREPMAKSGLNQSPFKTLVDAVTPRRNRKLSAETVTPKKSLSKEGSAKPPEKSSSLPNTPMQNE